ncbi:MAG: ATP-binding protein [Cenarchaeum symbiont of Oopsacas minuta]|nr:ATP-binding protein [Cenarchaeum symbiont of Oopsacas minuta]
MKIAAFFSGGKDSTYAIYLAKKLGHDLSCLITAKPHSAESKILHHPNINLTSLQAKSIGVPHLVSKVGLENESDLVKSMLNKAVSKYGIKGVVHGGIASVYQKRWFDAVCDFADVKPIGPVWGAKPVQYMSSLLYSKFSFMITAVSAGGLDESWLGCKIDQKSLKRLCILSAKHGFNLNFEGGEAETLVLDCPLFSRPLCIGKAKSVWDGYRGIFEIEEAYLGDHARGSKDKPAGCY